MAPTASNVNRIFRIVFLLSSPARDDVDRGYGEEERTEPKRSRSSSDRSPGPGHAAGPDQPEEPDEPDDPEDPEGDSPDDPDDPEDGEEPDTLDGPDEAFGPPSEAGASGLTSGGPSESDESPP